MNKKAFLETVECFLKKNRMSPTMFGIKAAKEPNFVFTLRNGREVREEKKERVLEYIYANDNERGKS